MSSVAFRHPIPYNCSTMAPSRPLVFLVVLYTVVKYTVLGLSRTTVSKAGHLSPPSLNLADNAKNLINYYINYLNYYNH